MFDYKRGYYKTYNPKLYTAKTVLWFTREEIKILKSCSRCNLWMFLLTTILIIVFLILYLTNAYPFTVSEAATVHTTIGILFLAHSLISLLGYYAILAENSCLIDIYCAMNGILIVSDITLLVIFNHFAEARVKSYFRNNLLIQVIVILFICVNSILIPAAFVVELQVRAHGSVDRRKTAGLPSGPALGSPPPPFFPSPRDMESGMIYRTTSDPYLDRTRVYQKKSPKLDQRSLTHTLAKVSSSEDAKPGYLKGHSRTQSQPDPVIMRQPRTVQHLDLRLDVDQDNNLETHRVVLPKIADPTPISAAVKNKRINNGPKPGHHSVTIHREEDEDNRSSSINIDDNWMASQDDKDGEKRRSDADNTDKARSENKPENAS